MKHFPPQNDGTRLSRRHFGTLAVGAAATLAWPAVQAQAAYPNKPVRIVVPYGAGDPPDIYARALADRLAPLLGQQVLIDDKPGASGTIGAAEALKAPADGYTLLYVGGAMMGITPQLRKTPYDPVKDFEPIGRATSTTLMVSVNKAFPANTWPEFVAEVKRNPGKYSIISSGDGTFLHFAAVQLMDAAGIQLLHVPYKSFGQGVTDIAAGTANVMLDHGSALQFVKAGTMKALLVLDDVPSKELPSVPTLKQHPLGFDLKAWFGLVAPAGTPKPVLEQLQAAMTKAASDPVYAERLPVGTLPSHLGPREFAAFMDNDRKTYGAMIKRLNLKLD